MTEAMPKITTFGDRSVASTTGLDASKLVEAAKSKLAFARSHLNEVLRDYEMKRAEINANAREKLEAVQREAQEALESLSEQTKQRAEPAREMIRLVERMLG
jgi:hypothetical protein